MPVSTTTISYPFDPSRQVLGPCSEPESHIGHTLLHFITLFNTFPRLIPLYTHRSAWWGDLSHTLSHLVTRFKTGHYALID